MNKITFLLTLACSLTTAIANGETLKCEKNEKYRRGGGKETLLMLETKGSEIMAITYGGIFYSGQEGGAYTCDFEVKRTDRKSEWVKKGNNLLISFKPESADKDTPESTIEIQRDIKSKSFKAEFNVSTIGFCGFGAEFPQTMELLPNGKCKTKF